MTRRRAARTICRSGAAGGLLAALNASKLAWGVSSMAFNLGSRFLIGDLTPALREEAGALGLAVVVWTVNEPAAIARMLDLKVDGIISDRPDLVREEMGRRGMALPRAWPVTP